MKILGIGSEGLFADSPARPYRLRFTGWEKDHAPQLGGFEGCDASRTWN